MVGNKAISGFRDFAFVVKIITVKIKSTEDDNYDFCDHFVGRNAQLSLPLQGCTIFLHLLRKLWYDVAF